MVMNYIELINNFWKADLEFSFTGNETKLYMFLLYTSNSLGWQNPFRLSYRQIALRVNLGINTVKSARNRLKQAGLIDFSEGKRGCPRDMGNKAEYRIRVSGNDNQPVTHSVTHPDSHAVTYPDTITKPKTKTLNSISPMCPPEAGFVPDETGQRQRIQKGTEKEKSCAKKERTDLVLPYDSERFAGVWRELADSPKWRGKTERALQYALNQLGKFEEEFAVCQMEAAVVNGWQGVVFADTGLKYQKWKEGRSREGGGAKRFSHFAHHDNGKVYEDF